ncbi:MAG TPA: intradiol ring-cleavage dioxygenase [Gemmatimonadaceae bacterium]|nr:intradiol ring-cleavage dioxygenase [Gemmatimonadaceae bacterium]
MDNDDKQIGRILTRREAVAVLGAVSASLLTGCSTGESAPANAPNGSSTQIASASIPGCVVRPAQTEGPYFVDEKLNRSDIRSDPSDGTVKPGTPLELTFAVSQLGAGSCTPIAGAVVDVWHCDADGIYSDVQDPSFNTRGKKYLRGYQVTDASGRATFKTIYPGWYRGRAVHIHFTVRTNPKAASAHEFTSQIYFDDAMNDTVFSQAPYKGKGQIRNSQDGIFRDGGSQLILAVKPATSGYAGTFDIALQTS